MASNRPIFNKLVIQGSFMGKLWNEIFKYQYLPFLITGVRQFSISFVADFIFCVAHPIVLIYNASVIRHRLVDTIKVYGSYLVELFTNNWINDKRKSKEDLDYDIQFYAPLQFSRNHIECLLWSKSYISNRQTDIGLTAVVIQRFWYDYRSNKMEPLQSQSPAKRELLGSSVVRT